MSRQLRRTVLPLTAAGLVAAVLVTLAAVPLLRGNGSVADADLIGARAPTIEAVDLDGRTWSLDDAEGRLVWVNFWATSCEPCRTEMPAMQRLAERHADRLLILGVDWGEGADAVAAFVDRYGIHYPILLDPRYENFYRWSSRDGLPRHYFVRDGIVVRQIIGPLDPAAMLAILDELLSGASG